MRNLKKLLAVIVAVCVLATMVIPAFAAETKTDAETVEILGVLKGDGAGVTDTYLAKGTNRFQAALLYLRLIGLEDEALAEASTDNFEDASLVYVGGQKVLAYIKANPDLGWKGVNAAGTVFEPTNPASAQMIYKVMLEALGYKQDVDFTWADAITFAADKGLTKIADVTELTNNDLAIALVEALKAKVKDSDKTLLEKLIEDKVITEAAAIEAGLMEEAPEELKVESVTADNLKQLVVTFNQEIKEAGDNDNYELETDGTATIDKDSDFSLQDDKKTVVITLTTAADENQDTVDLTVKDIESAKGVKMEEQTIEDIVLFDTTIPRALSAAVIGNDTIKVIFSEPIDPDSVDGDDITVDGGDYIVQDDEDYPALVNNNTEVNFKLYSLLDEGKLTVEVGGGIEDYAGFSAAKKSFTLDVVEDTDAPVVTGYKDAKLGEITLIFNEDIEFVDADPDEDKFYHTNSKNAAKEVTISGKELKMTFAEGFELPLGTAHIYIEKEMIQDMWDNENAKIAYTVEVETDVTKPTLDKVEQDGDWEDQIILTFSESLDQDSAENVDNYTLLDKDGKVLEKISGALFALDDGKVDDKKIIIVFDEELGGDYSIVVEKVEDLAGNAIEKVTKTFTIKDKDAPDFPSTSGSAVLYNPGEKDQMLKINFGEAMAITGTYSVLDLEKYQLDGKDLSDVDDATIKAINDNKAVEIKLPSKDGKNSFAVGDSLYIARVANAAGNKTTDMTSGEIIVGGSGKVEFDKAELTDKATIVVTLKDRLTTFKAADFTITDEDGDVTLKRVRHTVNSDGNSVVTFTVEERSTESADLTVISAATTESKNTYGETLVADTGITVDDKAAPEVDEVFYAADGSAIYVVFKEAVDEDTFSTRSDAKNGFTISGGGELASALYYDSTTVELTAKDDKPFTKNTNVSYDGNYGITDKAGNKVAAFSRTDVLKAW